MVKVALTDTKLETLSQENGTKVRHLLLCVEGVEVVVVCELSATGHVLEGEETDSVDAVH